MKNMTKDAAILFAITLIAGFVLGFVYNVTKEPIAQAEEKAAKEAYAEVFQDASDFNELAIRRRQCIHKRMGRSRICRCGCG